MSGVTVIFRSAFIPLWRDKHKTLLKDKFQKCLHARELPKEHFTNMSSHYSACNNTDGDYTFCPVLLLCQYCLFSPLLLFASLWCHWHYQIVWYYTLLSVCVTFLVSCFKRLKGMERSLKEPVLPPHILCNSHTPFFNANTIKPYSTK